MGCFWRGEEDGRMMAGGKESRREKEGRGFSFQLFPLKGTAWEQKLARVLEALRYTGCSTMGLFTSSQIVKGPKWLDEWINEWINFVFGCFGGKVGRWYDGGLSGVSSHVCTYVYVWGRLCVTGFEGYGYPTTASCGPKLLESWIRIMVFGLNRNVADVFVLVSLCVCPCVHSIHEWECLYKAHWEIPNV